MPICGFKVICNSKDNSTHTTTVIFLSLMIEVLTENWFYNNAIQFKCLANLHKYAV